MSVRTSVTLPKELLVRVDRVNGKRQSRSKLVEKLLIEYVANERPRRLNRRDMEIIDRNSKSLNREALESLAYQVDWLSAD